MRILVLALAALAAAGLLGMHWPGAFHAPGDGPGYGRGMHGGAPRHRRFMREGVPARFAQPGEGQARAGARVYQRHCAACHGAEGRGDGPAAASLSPPPADLAALGAMPMGRRADYLAWAIAEGGQVTGSAMPAFEDVLSDQQIRDVVAYLRDGI